MTGIKCKYCSHSMSFGNESLYRDKTLDIFIAYDILYLLKPGVPIADKIRIKYCPICGEKVSEE